MKQDNLDKLWNNQIDNVINLEVESIILKAKRQRNKQLIGIAIMTITLLLIGVFTFYNVFNQWNTFNLGLYLMILSLTIRIAIEFYSLYKREKKLITMPQKVFNAYLKKYYKSRLLINYIVTPICIIGYCFGFYLLLPYFKSFFSEGFYTYILVSGIVSLVVIIIIIANSVVKEQQFLKHLYNS